MRIVGGVYRGKNLVAPATGDTRPTSDRVRESVFNILEHGNYPRLQGSIVMDCFAGSGALGLEALSRGAAHAIFIDHNALAMAACRQNITGMKLTPKAETLQKDISKMQKRPENKSKIDIAFIDPPYGKGLGTQTAERLHALDWLSQTSVIILEMDKAQPEPSSEKFKTLDTRAYGRTLIAFLQPRF